MIEGHGGNIFEVCRKIGCNPRDIIDFSSNLNPLGPPGELLDQLKRQTGSVASLPEVIPLKAAAAFAAFHDMSAEEVLVGNGTTQFIFTLPPALSIRRALILGPTYADYADACRMHRVEHNYHFSREPDDFAPDLEGLGTRASDVDSVFICNPNNPTGRLVAAQALKQLCRQHPATRFMIDESYLPFVQNGEGESMMGCGLPNVIVLHSFSKIFRIPGLRIGFLTAEQSVIQALKRYQLPWNVNSLAQVAACFLLQEFGRIEKFIQQTRDFISVEKKKFLETVHRHSDIRFLPSDTVYLLGRLPHGIRAVDIQARLLLDRLLIRDCSNFEGLSGSYFRVSLKSSEDNRLLGERLIGSLAETAGLKIG